MINDDILIKFSIKRISEGHTVRDNWVDYTRMLRSQIDYIKSGFPGIGDGDLSILSLNQVKSGMRVILDDALDMNLEDEVDSAALLVYIHELSPDFTSMTIEIEGIGAGTDFMRDPDRKIRWRSRYTIDPRRFQTVLQLTSKPRVDGGSVYYYFNKSTRDMRW